MNKLHKSINKARKVINESGGGCVDQYIRIAKYKKQNNIFTTSNTATKYQTQLLRRSLKDRFGNSKVVVSTRYNSTLQILLPPNVNLSVLIEELDKLGLKLDKKV